MAGEDDERRKLSAAWLNIAAAGFVSAGSLPFLNALILEGWSMRTRVAGTIAAISLAFGSSLHLLGRRLVRASKPALGLDSPDQVFLLRSTRGRGMNENIPDDEPFPTEVDIDDLLKEFGGDPRVAIRALLQDVDALASDYEASVSKGYVRKRRAPAFVQRQLQRKRSGGADC